MLVRQARGESATNWTGDQMYEEYPSSVHSEARLGQCAFSRSEVGT